MLPILDFDLSERVPDRTPYVDPKLERYMRRWIRNCWVWIVFNFGLSLIVALKGVSDRFQWVVIGIVVVAMFGLITRMIGAPEMKVIRERSRKYGKAGCHPAVDANFDRAKEIAAQHGCQAFATEQDLIDAGVDAVSIAVPTTFHLKSAEPFLRAGVACLIEKPLAQDTEEAEKIKQIAEEHNTCLMVGHIERFNPIMRAMQSATESAGERIVPRFMEVHRVSPMTFRSMDIGVVMDMMIHDLDVVLMLMDGREPDEIQASGVAVVGEYEDLCNARLVWNIPEDQGGGQCVANITASRLAMKTERVTRITGEGGYIKIDYAAKTGMLIRKTANEIQMREVRESLSSGQDLTDLDWTELINIEPLTIDDGEPIVKEIEAFLEAARTGEQPAIDATAGFANVRTAERIVAAINHSLGTRAPAALS